MGLEWFVWFRRPARYIQIFAIRKESWNSTRMGWDVPKATFLDMSGRIYLSAQYVFSTVDAFFESLILGPEKVGFMGKCRLNPYLSRKEPIIIPSQPVFYPYMRITYFFRNPYLSRKEPIFIPSQPIKFYGFYIWKSKVQEDCKKINFLMIFIAIGWPGVCHAGIMSVQFKKRVDWYTRDIVQTNGKRPNHCI